MPITCRIPIRVIETKDFGELDYAVMAVAFACQNDLGRLADEAVYQADFAARLVEAGFQVCREVPVEVSFRTYVKTFWLDLVIENQSIYEIKAVTRLTDGHAAQLLNYLLLMVLRRGKLINFRTASIESRFVNAPATLYDRRQFTIDSSLWLGSESFRSMILEMLHDWGTGLELRLYLEAITELLGGEGSDTAMIPMCRDGIPIGSQRFHLVNQDSAFRFTALSKNVDRIAYSSHLKRLLRYSPLAAIHWINVELHRVTFSSIKR